MSKLSLDQHKERIILIAVLLLFLAIACTTRLLPLRPTNANPFETSNNLDSIDTEYLTVASVGPNPDSYDHSSVGPDGKLRQLLRPQARIYAKERLIEMSELKARNEGMEIAPLPPCTPGEYISVALSASPDLGTIKPEVLTNLNTTIRLDGIAEKVIDDCSG